MTDSPSILWPQGKQAALCLTYDDAHTSHHQYVAPFLKSHGLRGTFYLPIKSRFLEESESWHAVAEAGHELGNHTLFHPCYTERDNSNPRPDSDYNLRTYSLKRWEDEVRVANWALQQIDGLEERTYGNTCHNRFLGEGENRVCLDTLIPDLFVAGRGHHTGKGVDLRAPNFANLGTTGADHRTFAELQAELLQVREEGGWMIYTLHDVNEKEGDLAINTQEHRKLVEWLARESGFWVAPVVEVAQWVRMKIGYLNP